MDDDLFITLFLVAFLSLMIILGVLGGIRMAKYSPFCNAQGYDANGGVFNYNTQGIEEGYIECIRYTETITSHRINITRETKIFLYEKVN